MKKWLETAIRDYIEYFEQQPQIRTRWRPPVFAYADAKDPLFTYYKTLIGPSHFLPQELLPESKTVVTYFLPFEETLCSTNLSGRLSSLEWGQAYLETNRLISEINEHLAMQLAEKGYTTSKLSASYPYDEKRLVSDWSQRHVAYAAGLGTFGINHMLITSSGCAGRIGSFVTDLLIEPTRRPETEYCLYKSRGTCGLCVEHCVNNALFFDHFDRHRCHEMCLENANHLKKLGFADVCGKCVVGMPCSIY